MKTRRLPTRPEHFRPPLRPQPTASAPQTEHSRPDRTANPPQRKTAKAGAKLGGLQPFSPGRARQSPDPRLVPLGSAPSRASKPACWGALSEFLAPTVAVLEDRRALLVVLGEVIRVRRIARRLAPRGLSMVSLSGTRADWPTSHGARRVRRPGSDGDRWCVCPPSDFGTSVASRTDVTTRESRDRPCIRHLCGARDASCLWPPEGPHGWARYQTSTATNV